MKTPPHGLGTRLAHGALAAAVILQVGSSLFMQVPRADRPANLAFEMHETVGALALALALVFWAVVILRIAGTDAGRLFPWVSGVRLAALRADIVAHWRALRRLRLPPYEPEGSLSAAVHGLGLLLVSYMALSGTMYLVAPQVGYAESGVLAVLMDVHCLLGNVVWAYLFGHAGLALVHHFTGGLRLGEMWSFRRKPLTVELSE
ncbi:cytochrome b/b6 domain-containing protein [Roseibacterium sp. SDUM158016]|uniref:cytochrome b/b6 domain-containing protein n=1 Tax=Roseicyclus sediminis TaxID=2980997 RepID=UPI0021D161D5|nr:cytochrome b/b6 domain-containing protein [Roseibacterium sp. SDUM158016]MCU4654794.1 cytochrome b/b6 domain-containing protein [Roseibacterium sp. SDUM158016]